MACRAASTHALSKPTLANIEKRWEGMPLQEQAELWMALRDRMKENWAELTLPEKKAGKSAYSIQSHVFSSSTRAT
jgi:cytochrome c oxidase subunit 4